MAGKGTGKYYAPVYRAKKTPLKIRRIRLFKRCALIAAAVAIVAISIAAVQINKEDSESFVKVAASEHSLAGVATYPRVVGHSSPLASDYVPDNLVSLSTLPNGEDVFLRADAAEAFLEMCAAMSEDGLGIVPVKGYVSYDEQSNVLSEAADKMVAEGATAEEAKQRAKEEVSAPGEDEAQLGTSIDISTDPNCVDSFSLTEQFQWVARNACQYGFIIRYNDAARKATGSTVKPWHLRYVGKEAAEYMFKTNMCLEQYVKAVKSENPRAVEVS